MKISNETKIGVLATVAITLLVLGYNFLKGENIFTSSNTYFATYESVDGLFRSNPVVINGHTVGSVTSVSMDYGTMKLKVAVSVPEAIKVPKNSILKIINKDVAGSKGVELIIGDDSTGFAINEDYLKGDKEVGLIEGVGDVLDPLSKQVKNLIGKVDTAVDGVNLNSALADLTSAVQSFKQTADKFNDIMDNSKSQFNDILLNIKAVSADLRNSSPKVETILARIDSTTMQLEKLELESVSKKVEETLASVKTTIDQLKNNEGSIGKLMNDDALYEQLKEASTSIDSLAKDIQKYPRRYFGFTEKVRQKGDKQKMYNEGVELPIKTKD